MNKQQTTNQQQLPLVVGVDLGGTHTRTAVLQGSKLRSRVSFLTGENPTPDRIIPRICGAIQQALDEAHVALDQIAGIGVATPGELGHMTIDWQGERCNCGNIGCLEYLASGTAIARYANEVIAEGQGADLLAFASTMLEHTATVPDQAALPTHDPNTQPLDEYDELGGEAEPLLVNARTVARAAEAGIPLARDIITHAAEALGVGLVNIIHIYNPEIIILGG